jgi:cytochrome c oxidase subunit I+III
MGAGVMGVSLVIFLINVCRSLRRGAPALENPWGASSLEWSTSSPPPSYNFTWLPTVAGRDALWDMQPDTPVVMGLSTDKRETLSTTIMDAEPEHRHELAEDSLWPFVLAIVSFASMLAVIFHPIAFPLGLAVAYPVLFLWFWRNNELRRIRLETLKKLPLEAPR